MTEVKTNSHGVNAAIKAHILSDERMKEIGFTEYSKGDLFFFRMIKFPKTKRYKNFEVSFNVTIPRNGSDISIDVLDEAFCQAYDYQDMLDTYPTFEPALIIKEQVEEWMEYLQKNGVLSGHMKGEYI